MIFGKKKDADASFFILIYLSLSSPGFLAPLYHNIFGIIVMTALLLMYLAALMVIERIVAIEI